MTNPTAQSLEQHFDVAFSAPNGIKKLRELILTLAMQGKLVPQDPKDAPASELLKDIANEKARLVSEGKIKKQKPLPAISDDEKPYDLPQGWEWVRLGDIGVWRSGTTPSRTNAKYYDGNIPWVKSGEVKQGRIYNTEEKVSETALQECSLSLNPKGSVLVAMYGANIGEVGILEIEATTNQAVCACQTYTAFNEQYLLNLIHSLKPYFLAQGAGAAQPNISREKIIATVFPLPPLAEQQRIVAKIDQLMARCDALEALQQAKEAQRLSVHQAAIRQLLDAEHTHTAWQFLQRHFGELYSVKANVSELRKAILQLAVMGKLVPQDPNDTTASELLKDIANEKTRLITEGKIKKQKPLPAISDDEKPYDLPQGWEWVRLGDVLTKIHYGFTASADPQLREVRLLRITDIQENIVNWETVPGCDVHKDDVKHYLINNNDILIARTGGTVGKSYLVENISVNAVFASYLIRVVPAKNMLPTFVKKFLESELYWKQLYMACSGTGQPNVNGTSLTDLQFPLPPLAEQHRIVAKIDQLMSLCNNLEQQIDASQAKQSELLAAVMSGV